LKLVDGKECQKNEMICKLCRPGLGDEFHYICLCNCDEVKLLRQKYIPRYYLEYPHVSKLHQMLKNCNTSVKLLVYLYKKSWTSLEIIK
jgi:hypothetical protein